MNDAEQEEQRQQEEHEETPTMNAFIRGNRTRAQARKETFINRLFNRPEKEDNHAHKS